MPERATQFCRQSGCHNRVKRGFCAEHDRGAWAHREPVKRIAGRRLKRLRLDLFAREPGCRECAAQGLFTVATIRDHIVPLAEGGTEDESNIQPLCKECSDRKTQQESMRGKQRSSHYEQDIPIAVSVGTGRFVVTGPPGSGKTTWIQERARPGDIVFDMDDLAEHVTKIPRWPRPLHCVGALMAMRKGLLAWLSTSIPKCRVFVIVTDSDDAEQVARQIGAAVIRPKSFRGSQR